MTKSILPSAQNTTIFRCLWNFVCKQIEGDMAKWLAIRGDVEEHSGVDHGLGHTDGSKVVASARLGLSFFNSKPID